MRTIKGVESAHTARLNRRAVLCCAEQTVNYVRPAPRIRLHVTSRLRICLPTQHTTHLLLPNSTQLNCAAAVYSGQRWRSARAKQHKSLHPVPSRPVPSRPTLICIDLIRAAHPSARPSARPRPTHETNASTSHARIRGGRNSDTAIFLARTESHTRADRLQISGLLLYCTVLQSRSIA